MGSESFSASVRISAAFLAFAPSRITHRRENGVPFTSQRFGEQPAEVGVGAGNENHLLGIHDCPSHGTTVNRFDAGSKAVGYKK
jgi:hypothetical protein